MSSRFGVLGSLFVFMFMFMFVFMFMFIFMFIFTFGAEFLVLASAFVVMSRINASEATADSTRTLNHEP